MMEIQRLSDLADYVTMLENQNKELSNENAQLKVNLQATQAKLDLNRDIVRAQSALIHAHNGRKKDNER